MRVYFCGHRDWDDEAAILNELDQLPSGTVIMHSGGSPIGRKVGPLARKRGFTVVVFHPDWARHGKQAEKERNREVLREGKLDRVLAFCKSAGVAGDTQDMMEQARVAGVEVVVVSSPREGALSELATTSSG
jgi:hypothetical protein